MRRNVVIGLAVLIVAGAVLAVSATRTAGSAPSTDDFSTASNRGVRVELEGDVAAVRARFGSHPGGADIGMDAYLMATRGGRSFYRLASGPGSNCYAVGPALREPDAFGQIHCAEPFSRSNPLLDFTVLHGSPNLEYVQLYRVEGIAADGVAAIELRDANGSTLGEAKVLDNVYHFDVLPNTRVETFVALHERGNVVERRLVQPRRWRSSGGSGGGR